MFNVNCNCVCSPPTLLLTWVIDAKEHRDVCVVDIPHAYVQTPNEKVNNEHPPDLMKVKGRLVDMLLQTDPQLYTPFVTEENGMPVVYLEILMALYGMIKSHYCSVKKVEGNKTSSQLTLIIFVWPTNWLTGPNLQLRSMWMI
jgi:hypothetical protein